MLKKISIVFLLVIYYLNQCNAQCCGSKELMIQQITATPYIMYSHQYDSVPFLDTEFFTASVKVKSGEVYNGLKVKIDLYKDDLIYYNEILNKQLIIDKEIIEELKVFNKSGQERYFIKNICSQDSANQKKCTFYFVHFSDSISLWSKRKKEVVEYSNSTNQRLGYYYTRVKFYIVTCNQQIDLPHSKRSLAKLFPQNQKQIVNYIRKNHLKLKITSNLVQLFEEINRLEKLAKPTN